jgi:hypothetical protein
MDRSEHRIIDKQHSSHHRTHLIVFIRLKKINNSNLPTARRLRRIAVSASYVDNLTWAHIY